VHFERHQVARPDPGGGGHGLGSKKALYLALLEQHREQQPRFVQPGATNEPLVSRLPLLLDGWFARVQERPDTWKMIFHDSTGDADIQAARRQIQADARTLIAALLKAQPDLSIPKDELEPLAELLRSAMAGLALWSLEHPRIPRPLLVDLVIRAFRGLLQPRR
jgi:AcrR family transcriptional regulator